MYFSSYNVNLPSPCYRFVLLAIALICVFNTNELSAAGRFSPHKEKAVVSDLQKHIARLQSFNVQTSRKDLADFLTAFKNFFEETTGKKLHLLKFIMN